MNQILLAVRPNYVRAAAGHVVVAVTGVLASVRHEIRIQTRETMYETKRAKAYNDEKEKNDNVLAARTVEPRGAIVFITERQIALKSERSAARDREHWPRETTSSRERVSRLRLVGKILKPPTLPSIRRREVSLSRGRY
eukprot:SAG11_NODE_4365_length_1931_cov_3.419214_4_plen_139_part_00